MLQLLFVKGIGKRAALKNLRLRGIGLSGKIAAERLRNRIVLRGRHVHRLGIGAGGKARAVQLRVRRRAQDGQAKPGDQHAQQRQPGKQSDGKPAHFTAFSGRLR